jgi:hypothetical protein
LPAEKPGKTIVFIGGFFVDRLALPGQECGLWFYAPQVNGYGPLRGIRPLNNYKGSLLGFF